MWLAGAAAAAQPGAAAAAPAAAGGTPLHRPLPARSSPHAVLLLSVVVAVVVCVGEGGCGYRGQIAPDFLAAGLSAALHPTLRTPLSLLVPSRAAGNATAGSWLGSWPLPTRPPLRLPPSAAQEPEDSTQGRGGRRQAPRREGAKLRNDEQPNEPDSGGAKF